MKTKLVYISGGDSFAPNEIKAALDEIRKDLNLPADTVLFGLPVDDSDAAAYAEDAPVVQDHKILQFPKVKRTSILNVIENPSNSAHRERSGNAVHAEPPEEVKISDTALVVSDVDDIADAGASTDGDRASITALFEGLPSMSEDEPPAPAQSMVKEFGEYLDKESDKPEESPPAKKAKPFGRKGKGAFNNVLGDLFSFAGIAANDDAESFILPDFIKRP